MKITGNNHDRGILEMKMTENLQPVRRFGEFAIRR